MRLSGGQTGTCSFGWSSFADQASWSRYAADRGNRQGRSFAGLSPEVARIVRVQWTRYRKTVMVIASIDGFLAKRLKLKVNQARARLRKPNMRTFMGLCFTGAEQAWRRIAPTAIARCLTLNRGLENHKLQSPIAAGSVLLDGLMSPPHRRSPRANGPPCSVGRIQNPSPDPHRSASDRQAGRYCRPGSDVCVPKIRFCNVGGEGHRGLRMT
jgi:hypothetical protein